MIRSIEFRAMNTAVMLAAEGERAIEGMYAAKILIDECEQRFSRFLPASEVTALNRFAGEWFKVSDDLMEMLELSMRYHHETGGLFDPSILTTLKQIGYDHSMDDIRANGVTVAVSGSQPPLRSSFHEIEFNHTEGSVRLPRGMEVDLSGIAKGWIVKKTSQLLSSFVNVCAVSAGGDIQFVGEPMDGLGWDAFLEDPRDESRTLAQLRLHSGAVATSSIMKRSWTQGGKVRHHLIDPRTNEPAQAEWLSVTVISADVIHSDIYAKAILIGGKKEAARLLGSKPNLAYIVVDKDGNLLGSPNYKDYLYEFSTDTLLSTGAAW